MGYKFPDHCKNWQHTDFDTLYQSNTLSSCSIYLVPLEKVPVENCIYVVKNIQEQARDVDELILWLDCDREGEAIAYDVIDVCKSVNRHLHVQRAHFSALTSQDIERAIQNLTEPNRYLAEAVRTR
jgi:DNA topoisomerase-3